MGVWEHDVEAAFGGYLKVIQRLFIDRKMPGNAGFAIIFSMRRFCGYLKAAMDHKIA